MGDCSLLKRRIFFLARLLLVTNQTRNGSYHIFYQCRPFNVTASSMSLCSAVTTNFSYFEDYHNWTSPVTIAPSQLYDLGGVLGGTVMKDGWDEKTTLIYTSLYFSNSSSQQEPMGSIQTQSLAYTEDEGSTWTKLNFGENGNPILYKLPGQNVTSFRDPYVFECPFFHDFYTNSRNSHRSLERNKADGKKFLMLSGEIESGQNDASSGPRIFIYQQTEENDVSNWTDRGTLLELPPQYNASSPWSASYGTSFQLSSITRLGKDGKAKGDDREHELNIIIASTNLLNNQTQKKSWATWNAVNYRKDYKKGEIKASIQYSGLLDWGKAFDFTTFSADKNRQITVGWCPDDDTNNVLALQRGYSGVSTLFREIFVKIIKNVDSFSPELEMEGGSWKVQDEQDGLTSVITLGQKVLPETIELYRNNSIISTPEDRILEPGALVEPNSLPDNMDGDSIISLVPFEKQPKQSYYAIKAQLDFYGTQQWTINSTIDRGEMIRGGFRVLAGSQEWTDIYYDPPTESLVVNRTRSSVIESYGNSTEVAKHRLWPIIDPISRTTRLESLNLSIFIDNSIVEIYANDQTALTTRVYPWLQSSTGVSFFVQAPRSNLQGKQIIRATPKESVSHFAPQSVKFSRVELWEGLINAWPKRPNDTYLPIVGGSNQTNFPYKNISQV
ncbi:family 32 glycoside hydrolase [Phakopsora pachyrhizi]|uniref:Family 32 glycoside hydrolase n=1 Tax=Phakopsora pachyrhizi TaxID=170000 RepID=A0AAV0BPA7_PHAPC|nr:family 32 glycoside hydrolase [Phakopsora pachyrhizi]